MSNKIENLLDSLYIEITELRMQNVALKESLRMINDIATVDEIGRMVVSPTKSQAEVIMAGLKHLGSD